MPVKHFYYSNMYWYIFVETGKEIAVTKTKQNYIKIMKNMFTLFLLSDLFINFFVEG